MQRFDGKVAFITGAASGIGRATALRLASEGGAILCADLNLVGANETVALIEAAGGRGAAVTLDVRDEAAVAAALEKTVAQLGGLDVVFNNAGIVGSDWEALLAVNLDGVYHGLIHGCRILAERGGGAIVNTASLAGIRAVPPFPWMEFRPPVRGFAGYQASKAAVIELTKQFAVTYGPLQVRVNAIAPAFTATPLVAAAVADERMRSFWEQAHPLRRIGAPEDIASAVAFLASDDASFVTGVTLPVDGGYLAS